MTGLSVKGEGGRETGLPEAGLGLLRSLGLLTIKSMTIRPNKECRGGMGLERRSALERTSLESSENVR